MDFNTLFFSLLSFLIFFTSGWATDPKSRVESVHYGLAVGQGQCSTTISTIYSGTCLFKIAVTADIGTSSLRTDRKFSSGYDYKRMTPVLQRRMGDRLLDTSAIDLGQTFSTSSRIQDPSSQDPARFKSPDAGGPAGPPFRKLRRTGPSKPVIGTEEDASMIRRGASISGDDTETLKDSFEFLTSKLKDVVCWFVFLSHPDKDHINYFPSTFFAIKDAAAADSLPPPKVFLIAGGEWFHPNSTEQIREVIALWKSQKDNILSLFPFQDASLNAREFEEWMGDHSVTKADPRSFNPKKDVNGQDLEAFHGTLTTCLDAIYAEKRDALQAMLAQDNRFPDAIPGLFGGGWALLQEYVLDKIYIWSLDYRTGGDNAQSLVWSHAVDDLGWTFVYTGDAEKKTFEKISSVLDWHKSPEGQRTRSASASPSISHAPGRPTQQTRTSSARPVGSPTLDDICLSDGVIESWHKKAGQPLTIEAWDPSKEGVIKTIQGSGNLVMLHAMHHGSQENFSAIALRLFTPNACFFSAGNGASFAHPHYQTVMAYATRTSSTRLWSSYDLVGQMAYDFIAFDEKGGGDKKEKAWAVCLMRNKPLLLCPNTYGTIIIDKEGFSVPYIAPHTGYIMYSLLRAYEIEGRLWVDRNELRIADLSSQNDKMYQGSPEAYFGEAFWDGLRGKILRPNAQDSTVYEESVDAQHKLRMFEKTLGGKKYCYFYILQKLSIEADAAGDPAPAQQAG